VTTIEVHKYVAATFAVRKHGRHSQIALLSYADLCISRHSLSLNSNHSSPHLYPATINGGANMNVVNCFGQTLDFSHAHTLSWTKASIQAKQYRIINMSKGQLAQSVESGHLVSYFSSSARADRAYSQRRCRRNDLFLFCPLASFKLT
jgi:hypothetical protein